MWLQWGFFLVCLKVEIKNIKVKNRWNFIQNKNTNYCHLLLGINEVIGGIKIFNPLMIWFDLEGFFSLMCFFMIIAHFCVSSSWFFVENGGTCHQRPWWEEVTTFCFYNWSPLHVPIHFVGFGGIFHDSNGLMRNCFVLDVCLYVACMMMWRPITW